MLSKPFFTSEKQFENALVFEIRHAISNNDYNDLSAVNFDIIQQFIYPDNAQYQLIDAGVYQQLPIKGYGTTDIVIIVNRKVKESGNSIMDALIIELKNDDVNQDCFEQICRYVSGFKQLNIFHKVEGVLVGSGIKNGHYLYNCLKSYIHFYEVTMTLTGANFEYIPKGYHRTDIVTDEDFKKLIEEKINILPF